jgi:hypothetical protein
MLTALHLRLMRGLVVATSVFGLVAGAALVVLSRAGFLRSLLRSRVGILAALDLGFVAGLIVAASVLFFRHDTSPMSIISGYDLPGCDCASVDFHHITEW